MFLKIVKWEKIREHVAPIKAMIICKNDIEFKTQKTEKTQKYKKASEE